MANKSELKLADGSRWEQQRSSRENKIYDKIVDADGDEVYAYSTDTPSGVALDALDGVCWATDALAAIRAVDGDTEYLELVEIREKLAAVELERDAAFAQCQRREQWASEAARLSIENEAMSARCAALVRRTQVEVYDEGFSAGFEAAEKALGLNYTHVVEHENPYRKTSNNG